MPVLHFRITSHNQVINLDRTLHAQQFIFKRAVVVKNPSVTIPYGGGVGVQLNFLGTGTEIISNLNNEILYIPFNDDESIADRRYDLNFSSEDIRRSFQTNTYFYNNMNQPIFDTTGTNGELFYIDLYFEFQSIYNYNAY